MRSAQANATLVRQNLDRAQKEFERSKELLREFAKLNPEDPRAELWSKV